MKTAKRLIFVALVLISAPAMAEDVSVHTLCQMLPQHVPAAGVNYVPEQDVHGRPVASADVNKVLKNDFDAVDIPVEYNVLNGLGVNLPPGSQAQPMVAIVRVFHDGRVQYNGNDVTPQAQVLCARRSTATVVSSNPQGLQYNPHTEPKLLGQLQYSTVPAAPKP